MNKWFIAAGIVLVIIVGGVVAVRSMRVSPEPALIATTGVTPAKTPMTTVPLTASISATGAPTTTPSPTMKTKQYTSPPPMTIDPKKTYSATITTDKGGMTVKLFVSETPITVNNFVFLARDGFYNDTVFHRVIKGFMIQGGDPLGTGMGGPGYKFADEKITRDYTRGTIAMANSGPNTNGSQFFIMQADNALPKNYVIFGAIDPADAASLATLDAIANAPTTDNGMGETSKPVTPTMVQSVQIKEE